MNTQKWILSFALRGVVLWAQREDSGHRVFRILAQILVYTFCVVQDRQHTSSSLAHHSSLFLNIKWVVSKCRFKL